MFVRPVRVVMFEIRVVCVCSGILPYYLIEL